MLKCALIEMCGGKECQAPVNTQGEAERIALDGLVGACDACNPIIYQKNREEVAEWREAATIDYDTGAYNRMFMAEQILEAANRVYTRGEGFIYLEADVVGLGLTNFHLGHDVGDQLLRLVAKDLQGERRDDIVARIGGDEFGVLMKVNKKTEEGRRIVTPEQQGIEAALMFQERVDSRHLLVWINQQMREKGVDKTISIKMDGTLLRAQDTHDDLRRRLPDIKRDPITPDRTYLR